MRARALGLALACAVNAASAAAEGPEFKLTLGRYASSDGNPASDANLRATLGDHVAWLGVYQDRAGLRQWRTGYERHVDGGWLRSVWSLQNASGGAWVGAVNAEVGGSSYAIVGWGRTNLRPYVNLNYDPNDAVTLGIGTRALAHTELSLFQVRDDRLGTGQQVTHFVLRRRFDDDQRVTLDLFHKRGRIDGDTSISATSWTLGYDRGTWFARYAYDPYAGFAEPTQRRVSLGYRF